jgi:uncharacterized membrane protein YczE
MLVDKSKKSETSNRVGLESIMTRIRCYKHIHLVLLLLILVFATFLSFYFFYGPSPTNYADSYTYVNLALGVYNHNSVIFAIKDS